VKDLELELELELVSRLLQAQAQVLVMVMEPEPGPGPALHLLQAQVQVPELDCLPVNPHHLYLYCWQVLADYCLLAHCSEHDHLHCHLYC
jgi:hypothetical protein